MKIVNVREIQELDKRTIEDLGIPSLVLMERASLGVVDNIRQFFSQSLKQGVVILAGTGNNGGDGLAVARLLYLQKIPVHTLLLGNDSKRSKDNAQQLAINRRLGIPETKVSRLEGISPIIDNHAVIVDALFGVGLSRPIEGIYAEIIQMANHSQKIRVAIDIPSGIHGDTGTILGIGFQADLTVTCAFPKTGLLLDAALAYVGQLAVVDIGIPAHFADEVIGHVLDKQWISPLLPAPRLQATHKGTYGRLAIVAGSESMSGAAVLTANAALLSGVGLVYVMVPRCVHSIVASQLPDALVTPVADENGCISLTSQPLIEDMLNKCDAAVIGPGLGTSKALEQLLSELLEKMELPLLIDADGLNNFAANSRTLSANRIMTPHVGELGRLLKMENSAILNDRLQAARDCVNQYHCYLVLKGANTIIMNPQQQFWVNRLGNPGMARGGSGDLLSGLIGGLLAQGLTPQEASSLGVYWHALAGDRTAEKQGETPVRVMDMIHELPLAWKDMLSTKN